MLILCLIKAVETEGGSGNIVLSEAGGMLAQIEAGKNLDVMLVGKRANGRGGVEV